MENNRASEREGGAKKRKKSSPLSRFPFRNKKKYPPNALSHRPALLARVLDGRIAKPKQLTAALSYLASVGSGDDFAAPSSAAAPAAAPASAPAADGGASGAFFDESALDEAAGVGVVVTAAQIEETVNALVSESEAALVEQRYRFPAVLLVKRANEALRWAEGAAVKSCVDAAVLRLLGPKTKEDEEAAKVKVKAPPKVSSSAAAAAAQAEEERKKNKEAAAAAAQADSEQPSPSSDGENNSDPYASFASPADNNKVHTSVPMSDGSTLRVANTREQLAEHLRRTGGRVVTRFPPEPNGYLHLGHAKACFVDFGLAENREGGVCYLRFDDTNPEGEFDVFFSWASRECGDAERKF